MNGVLYVYHFLLLSEEHGEHCISSISIYCFWPWVWFAIYLRGNNDNIFCILKYDLPI